MTEIEKTLQLEGGANLTDDPNDPGGVTKYGISQVYNPEVDVRNLTLEQAIDIYKKKYWAPLLLDKFQLKAFRWKVFDIAVNQGPFVAGDFLNKVKQPDTPSGIWELVEMQMKRYVRKVKENPAKLVYLGGWTNRAFDRGDDLT